MADTEKLRIKSLRILLLSLIVFIFIAQNFSFDVLSLNYRPLMLIDHIGSGSPNLHYSNLRVTPPTPTENEEVELSINWTGDVNTVLLESNFTGYWRNYTIKGVKHNYFFKIRWWYLTGGQVIGYRWLANDSNNNWRSTELRYFQVYYPWSDWRRLYDGTKSFASLRTVIFRLDDVGPFWYKYVTKRLINTFIQYKIPITISIVPFSENGLLSNDEDLYGFLRRAAANRNLVEIAQHGWNHSNHLPNGEFGKRPYNAQYLDIRKGKQILEDLFQDVAGNIITFTVPYDVYDENTTRAVANLGFKVFSSKLQMDPWDTSVTPPIQHNDFDEFGLLHLDWNVYIVKNETGGEFYDPRTIVQKCLDELNQYGICVVLMHPQDFAMDSDKMNEAKYKVLVEVLDNLTRYEYISFKTMREYFKWRSLSKPFIRYGIDYYAKYNERDELSIARKTLLGRKEPILLKSRTIVRSTADDKDSPYYDVLNFKIDLDDQMRRSLLIKDYGGLTDCKNNAKNPSFENGAPLPDEWSFTSTAGNPSGILDFTIRHSGSRSVSIIHDSDDDQGHWAQVIKVSPSTKYYIVVWFKATDNGIGHIHIWLDFFNSTWSWISGEILGSSTGTFNWRKVEEVITTPPTAAYMGVVLAYNNGTGTAWFDDVEVTDCSCDAELIVYLDGAKIFSARNSHPSNYTIDLTPYSARNKKANLSIYLGKPISRDMEIGYEFSGIEIISHYYGNSSAAGGGSTSNYSVINLDNVYLPENSRITLNIVNYDDWYGLYPAEIKVSINDRVKFSDSNEYPANYTIDISHYSGMRVNISIFVGKPISNDEDVGYRFNEIYLEYYKEIPQFICARRENSVTLEYHTNEVIENAVICKGLTPIIQSEREYLQGNHYVKEVTVKTLNPIDGDVMRGVVILPKRYNATHKITKIEFIRVKNPADGYEDIILMSECPLYDLYTINGIDWKVCWWDIDGVKDAFEFIITSTFPQTFWIEGVLEAEPLIDSGSDRSSSAN